MHIRIDNPFEECMVGVRKVDWLFLVMTFVLKKAPYFGSIFVLLVLLTKLKRIVAENGLLLESLRQILPKSWKQRMDCWCYSIKKKPPFVLSLTWKILSLTHNIKKYGFNKFYITKIKSVKPNYDSIYCFLFDKNKYFFCNRIIALVLVGFFAVITQLLLYSYYVKILL